MNGNLIGGRSVPVHPHLPGITTQHGTVLHLGHPFDEGLGAFDMLGLDMKTLQLHPKSAEKFVMKF